VVESVSLSPPSAVAVVGTGSIGLAFALVFARAGSLVRCWDVDPDSMDRARADLHSRLELLDAHHVLGEAPDAVASRVGFHADLESALRGAVLVQECAPERLDLKQELFRSVGDLTGDDVVLASSSSAIVPSALADGLAARDRLLVAHPGNPPYLLPVIEVVQGPYCRAEVAAHAGDLYAAAGLYPVRVRHEVEGFVFNRLQGAVLREAYCLVRDGVASVEDIDAVVRLGLGRRWGVVGPFETVDLNTRGGIEVHAERMGPAYARMGRERGQDDPWTPELVAEVVKQRRALLPLENWAERVAWRDEELARMLEGDQERATS
jgi:3-hydroxyacyl-CoA dehydrogenase